MEIIRNNDYVLLKRDLDTLYFVYKLGSENMNDTEWQETLEYMASFIKDNKLTNLYADRRDCLFIVHPELQDWLLYKINPIMIDAGLQKYAQVVSKELFANVSGVQMIESIAEKNQQKHFAVKFFDTSNNALEWIGKSPKLII